MKLIEIVFIVLSAKSAFSRTLHFWYNPWCPKNISCLHYPSLPDSLFNNLIYVRSDSNDLKLSAHILVSSVDGIESLVLISSAQTNISLNWFKLLDHDTAVISVHGRPILAAQALSIPALYEFVDEDDSANVSHSLNSSFIPLREIGWGRVHISASENSFSLESHPDDPILGPHGKLLLKWDLFGSKGSGAEKPHLAHNEISSGIDVILDNLSTSAPQSRFAVQLLVASEKTGAISFAESASIDDEFTPGIFRTCGLSFPDSSGYVVWKPVSYRDTVRSTLEITRATANSLEKLSLNSSLVGSLLWGYFGARDNWTVSSMNISFGKPLDKYYASSNYLAWNVGGGVGAMPVEPWSALVLAVLVLCAALPVSGAVFALFAILRRLRRQKNTDTDHLITSSFVT